MKAPDPKERIVIQIGALMKERALTASEAAPMLGLTSKRLHRLLRGHHVHETVGSLQRYLETFLKNLDERAAA